MFQATRNKLAAVGALVLAPVYSAYAAVPAEITTAIDAIGDDGVTIAKVILLAVVAIFAIKFLRKGL